MTVFFAMHACSKTIILTVVDREAGGSDGGALVGFGIVAGITGGNISDVVKAVENCLAEIFIVHSLAPVFGLILFIESRFEI